MHNINNFSVSDKAPATFFVIIVDFKGAELFA
jgi:hypothetical protein